MNRELWLLRHAKADRTDEMDDFDRPLKKRGKRAAQRLGLWMKTQQLIPDYIVTSPAKRAYATAEIVYKALGIANQTVHTDSRLYAESFEQMKAVLAECPPQSTRVLLVGHNPALEELLINLVGEAVLSDDDKLLPTAALARLAMPDDWTRLEAGCGKLLSITYAKSLPENDN
jgi:phosphohistidine phosphatase